MLSNEQLKEMLRCADVQLEDELYMTNAIDKDWVLYEVMQHGSCFDFPCMVLEKRSEALAQAQSMSRMNWVNDRIVTPSYLKEQVGKHLMCQSTNSIIDVLRPGMQQYLNYDVDNLI